MTRRERKLLEEMFRAIETVSVTGAEYTETPKGLVRKEIAGMSLVHERLANGSEYREGWERCRIVVYHYLRDLGLPTGGR